MIFKTPYDYLDTLKVPRMLVEARRLYGVREVPGTRHNPTIVGWALEMARARPVWRWIGDFYRSDEIPWCGLFLAVVAHRAGKTSIPRDFLKARAWSDFGRLVPDSDIHIGDVLVFWRGSAHSASGHVGLAVGHDERAYHVLGGNQSNAVTITRIPKHRLICARNDYRIGRPAGLELPFVSGGGGLSEGEA